MGYKKNSICLCSTFFSTNFCRTTIGMYSYLHTKCILLKTAKLLQRANFPQLVQYQAYVDLRKKREQVFAHKKSKRHHK
jgi:hypothetical protein